MNSQVLRSADRVSWKIMDDLVIVVHLDTGAYFSLNETASAIWQQVIAGKSRTEVAEQVADNYEVDVEALGADVDKCIEEWLNEGLVCEVSDSSAQG